MLQYKPLPYIYILAVPEYSYLLKSYLFNQNFTSTVTQQDFNSENLRYSILGLIFGLDFNCNEVTIGARVGWDLVDNNGSGTSTLPHYRNIWGQITMGFLLWY